MAERTAFEEVFRKTLSVARLEPYYRKTSSFEAMMEFYEWNLKLSAAFLTVFQTFEVVLRNAVAEALIKAYGYHWFMDKSFRITLRAPMRSMLEEALEDDMDRHGNNSSDGVIGALKFGFWQGLFNKAHKEHLWGGNIRGYFPYCPENMKDEEFLERMSHAVNNVRKFRNRISHCEPIFNQRYEWIFGVAMAVIGYREPAMADWLSTVERVSDLIAQNPVKHRIPQISK